jgi:hypothetical protein
MIGTHITSYAEGDGEAAAATNLSDCYKNYVVNFKHKASIGNGGVTGVDPTWRETETANVKATNRCYMLTFTSAAEGQTIGFVSQHELSGYEPI